MKTKAAIASMCRRSSAGSTAGKPNIDDLITHTLPLERIHEGVVPMKRGESIRYHQCEGASYLAQSKRGPKSLKTQAG
ncbi:hypothetical protein ABNQ24_12855 [Ralstonia pseudosolanacearum]